MAESVWDYPRPPAVEATNKLIEVVFDGRRIASTREAVRVLETSHPPVYYLAKGAFTAGSLRPAKGTSICEFKGVASYFDVIGPNRVATAAAWGYENPSPGYSELIDRVAVYPSAMDACLVDGEQAEAQEGDFYGGWITGDIVGPFKGGPGTWGW